jgi:hypothetical protein
MRERLKPMTAKDILDVTFTMARERFWTLQGVTFLSFLPAGMILLLGVVYFAGVVGGRFFGPSFNNPAIWQEFFSGFGIQHILVLVGLFLLALVALLTGCMFNTHANIRVFQAALHQTPCSVKEAFRGMKRKWLAYFLAGILIGVMGIIIKILLIVIPGAFSRSGSEILPAILKFIISLLRITVNFLICLTPVIIALEDTTAVKAIIRAFKLLSGHRLRVLGIFALTYFLAYALFIVMGGILGIPIMLAVIHKQMIFFILTLFSGIGVIFMFNIMIAFAYGPLTAIYHDLIIRKEGYDLRLQLQDELTSDAPETASNTRSPNA